ncbi:MAG TPA: bifunctional diaminohydroxyphosphoribosylaminopyrimidine deaminase/5-amino-6-(5-phosphoribosylamino)uracil reductase RibD [Puia sp.]|jgi:diaminohydroxyphosphoribosylaminopyrimidine deaminase/5-amino-6-(5-phosphoribosylamino)uracil reductase|nr:bifunctional diaminohydroxyphosphoribosylaminopyrimidine deaminase/5-amino-6-(5-phosphoribosylamino)uracil reductase RibD [Puia sp.]
MYRCLELALLGAGHTAPNPMVGSVLVYEDRDTGKERIIGEGYHEQYGQAHAEANCIASVKEEDRPLIAQSTLYVSLEPCAHYGKQPPCADLIIGKKIPRVVAGCRDPFPQVNGKGIEKLLAAGVEVMVGVLEAECMEVNRRFFTFHTKHRPYIVLKWAQSADGKIGGAGRTFISNEYSNRLVHKWRAEEAAILVGTRTALMDDPALTVRLWEGGNPIRLVIDKELRLPSSLQLFDGKVRTIVFNLRRHEEGGAVEYYQLSPDSSLVQQVSMALTQLKIQSVLVEGGARMLQAWIDEGYWDEARVITNNELRLPGGLPAPELKDARPGGTETLLDDTVRYYRRFE